MKSIKRIWILLVVFILLFTVTACKDKEKKEQSGIDNETVSSSESDVAQENEQDFTQEEVLKGEEESTDTPNASDSTVSSDSFDNVFEKPENASTKPENNVKDETSDKTSDEVTDETGDQQTENVEESEKEDFGVSEDVEGSKYGPIQH